jgi:DNA-binding GntR family transcriptional regulator
MTYVRAQGRTPATQTLSKREIPATPSLAALFGLPAGSPLFAIRRLRSIDGRAVLVERIIVNPAIAPDLLRHTLDLSLTGVLKSDYGISVSRNKVSMRPFALLGDDAETLRVRSGVPGLSVTRISFDPLGRIVEYDEESWRHDAVTVSVDIQVG